MPHDNARIGWSKPVIALQIGEAKFVVKRTVITRMDTICLSSALFTCDYTGIILCPLSIMVDHAIYKESQCWEDERSQAWLASHWHDFR